MTDADRLGLVDELMARYNAQDAAGYAALMTEDAVEAGYRGAVLREGREGVRSGLAAMFAEFPQNRAVVHAAQRVVVDHGAGDAAVLGQHAGLGLDRLGGEDAAHGAPGAQQGVAVEQLEVAGQLLDAVDLAAALDLHRDREPVGVAAHQVDRTDGGGELPAHQHQAVGQGRGVLGEQLL